MPADEMLGEDKTRHEKAEERRITDLEWALAALLDGVDVGAGLVIADTQRAGSNVRAVFVGYHSQHAVMQARFALGGQAVLCAPSTTAGDSATSAEPTMPASEAGQAVGVDMGTDWVQKWPVGAMRDYAQALLAAKRAGKSAPKAPAGLDSLDTRLIQADLCACRQNADQNARTHFAAEQDRF